VVCVAGSPAGVAAGVRSELRAIDPSLPVVRIDTIDEQLEDLLFQDRLVTDLTGLFGLLVLAGIALGVPAALGAARLVSARVDPMVALRYE
jgi:hypothetical protein